MKFFVRILPCDDFDWDNIKIEDNKKTIYIRCSSNLKLGHPSNTDPYFWCFKTDGVFYNTRQEEFYDIVMKGILKTIYEGVDSVVISYGQTCSGKSFSMCALRSMYELNESKLLKEVGYLYEKLLQISLSMLDKKFSLLLEIFINVIKINLKDQPGKILLENNFIYVSFHRMKYRGIVPRFIHDLFLDVNSKIQDWKVNIFLSYVEFHGNKVTDLLRNSCQSVRIKEVSLVKVRSEEHLLSLIFRGEKRRNVEQQSAWYLGAHCATAIITLHLECLSLLKSCALICKSKVHFVDIAGIETVGKRKLTSFKNAHEQGMANKCKSFLEHLLINYKGAADLASDEYKFKRRSCGMLEYLGSSVSPACILRLIGHIRPTFQDLEVSMSTLKLGQRTRHIQPVIPKYNIVPNFNLLFRKFKEELGSKNAKQCFLKKLLCKPTEMESGNVSKERVEHLERLFQSYIDGKVSELSVIGDAEMPLILQILKSLYLKKVESLENLAVKDALASRKKSINRSISGSLRSNDPSNTKFETGKTTSRSSRKVSLTGRANRLKTVQKKDRPSSLPLVAEVEESEPTEPDKPKSLVKQEVFTDNLVPDSDNQKLWSDFLIENAITSEHLDNLAELTKRNRVLFEIASAEYSGIRTNLEKQRLNLKLSTLKRRKIQVGHENHFSEAEKEQISKHEIINLEDEAKSSKELLEMKFNDWIDSAKEFMEEKCLLREKFEKYCEYLLTYHHPDFERKTNRKSVEPTSFKEEEHARELFNSLQKRLRK